MARTRPLGLLLVALGLVLVLARLGGGETWPLFIVVPGVAMAAVAVAGPLRFADLAVPGAIVTTVGMILLVQEATQSFETWSYAWGLVIAGVGAGTFLKASIVEDPAEQKEGVRLVGVGLAFFAAFGAFFEFLIFGGWFGGALGWLLPAVLIAAGVWLLRRRR